MRAQTPNGRSPARHSPFRGPAIADLPMCRATDREVGVVAAVLVAGSEKAAAHRLGLSHSTVKHHLANARSKVGAATTAQLVWILASRLPQPDGIAQTDE
jgi:DNA-binding NarL/FixJ family response regulator